MRHLRIAVVLLGLSVAPTPAQASPYEFPPQLRVSANDKKLAFDLRETCFRPRPGREQRCFHGDNAFCTLSDEKLVPGAPENEKPRSPDPCYGPVVRPGAAMAINTRKRALDVRVTVTPEGSRPRNLGVYRADATRFLVRLPNQFKRPVVARIEVRYEDGISATWISPLQTRRR